MGVKPPLPAPTESSTLQTSGGSVTGTDLATDVSRRTEHTSFSIPEDGSPVTISTKRKKDKRDRQHEGTLTRATHQSQTSLLIEYFEGGKGPNVHSRPSVRVKVTPSAARKIKDTNEHIQITEAGGARRPSYTRRISLGPRATGDKQIMENTDDRSLSSYTSAAEDSSLAGRYAPVEIEFLHRDHGSDLSATTSTTTSATGAAKQQRYIQQNPSEISSMPPDSMLEGNGEHMTPRRNRSRSLSRDVAAASGNMLKTPSRRRSRSLSRERLTQKVIEKLGNSPRVDAGRKRRPSSKTRSRSGSNEQMMETSRSGKRRSSRHHHEDDLTSGLESSLLTNSQLSSRRKSGDQYSFRSGTSKSSINNPKLLETVEDAIRRLILPELTTLKHEQKMQQNRSNFEREKRDSVASGSVSSRGELIRRVSKHASAPDVSARPKVVLNRDDNNPGTVLSGNSVKGRKDNRHEHSTDSPSERSFERDMSEETVIRTDENEAWRRSKAGHQLRDVAAGTVGGAILTSAALEHHDTKSSGGKRDRKRKGSRSHSRSTSVAESIEEIFGKHEVPPMPMRSEIYSSEVTRDSILSARTEESSSPSDRRRAEIREVSRGSPREVLSPASRTPTRTPVHARKGLRTHHSNLSRGDLSIHSAHSSGSLREDIRHSVTGDVDFAEAERDEDYVTNDQRLENIESYDKQAYYRRAHNRGLSPIQSVASASFNEDSNLSKRYSPRAHSSGSLTPSDQHDKRLSGLSIQSLSSAASTNIARSKRPKGINLENGQDVLDQHALGHSEHNEVHGTPKDLTMDDWYQQQHEQNDRYRESYGNSDMGDPIDNVGHMTNYTDDGLDASYLNEVKAVQQVHGMGANPEYVQTPVAVESAVASLLDPSIVSERSKNGNKRFFDHLDDGQKREFLEHEESHRGTYLDPDHQFHEQNEGLGNGSPTKSAQNSAANSPRQSVARSLEDDEERVVLGATSLPVPDDPMPEPGYGLDSDSDLNTNPSIIQGPLMGAAHQENRAHWPYQPTPRQSQNDFVTHSNEHSAQASLKAVAAGMLSVAATAQQNKDFRDGQAKARDFSPNEAEHLMPYGDYDENANHDFGPIRDDYMSNQPIPTPPTGKFDEGYISAPHVGFSPEPKHSNAKFYGSDGMNGIDDLMADEDPFFTKTQTRHMSANSHGMPSPLYDSATGGGLDRIHSKDIVALMDHLTVRDAQRNARDTEILVTLVRSAAEMRNSFEDMKRFIADQDEILIDTGNKQHERTIQKVIGGPRPQPLGTPRAMRRPSVDDEYTDDLPTKRRNIFRRALKGLSGRSSNDLGKIEDMLVQLLGDVEGLKAAQDVQPGAHGTRPVSVDSYDNARAVGPDGYEPEGQAGTSSTGNHSGYFSNPPSRQASRVKGNENRRESQNRISTVIEGDEELETPEGDVSNDQFENDQELRTPTREFLRSGSVPLGTPPQVHIPTGAQSNENTPKTGTDRSRKHKSSSSSFFPKISRWSKTTASSVGENFKGAGRRERPLSEASRSGSEGQYNANDHYDPQGDDRLRSNDSLEHEAFEQADRPPSPLIPSQVSEKPKYQAQRDSLNLQHPQPRLGPGQRYHHQLETQAHNFGSPISPTSDQWGSNPSLARFPPGVGNRQSGGAGNLSPISDAGYSDVSASEQAAGSHRSPKAKDTGPLIPSRPPRMSTKDNRPTYASPLSSEHLAPEQRYSNGSASYESVNGSPRSASGSVPQRKPTGPRPITSSGSFSPTKPSNSVKQNRYRGSPNHVELSEKDIAV